MNAAGDIASLRRSRRCHPLPDRHRRSRCHRAGSPASSSSTGAIATSGTYERGAHLIDPHTRRPATRLASASVTGPDLGLADALATAVAVAGRDGPADGLGVGGLRGTRRRPRWHLAMDEGFPLRHAQSLAAAGRLERTAGAPRVRARIFVPAIGCASHPDERRPALDASFSREVRLRDRWPQLGRTTRNRFGWD